MKPAPMGATQRTAIRRVGGSTGHHFVQTMIYGLFHWRPLEEQLADNRGSDGD